MASSTLVVIPAFNEEVSISTVIDQAKSLDLDVLVVDDGSSDATASVAAIAGAKLLRLPVNIGVGGALRAGFHYAIDYGYTSVVRVDADGQHPLHQIRSLQLAAERHDAHLVIGSRFMSANATHSPSWMRRFAMRFLSFVASVYVGKTLTDSTSGFRIIREPLLSAYAKSFPVYYLGDTFESLITAGRAGYRIVETPASLTPRTSGESSATRLRAVLYFIKALVIVCAHLHPKLTSPNREE